MDHELVFNVVAWHAEDVRLPEDGVAMYAIKAFGVTADGAQVALTIRDFTPFFYVRVPDAWTHADLSRMREQVAASVSPSTYAEIAASDVVLKKDFWGFSNGHRARFVRYCCKTLGAMRRLVGLFGKGLHMPGGGVRKPVVLKPYESNIEPYVRFMHIRDIQPCGWIRVPAGAYRRNTDILPAKARHDYDCSWKAVHPVHGSTAIAPLKVASFDIECVSRGGEFPVAKVCGMQRLARDLFVLRRKLAASGMRKETVADRVCDAVAAAFGSKAPVEGVVCYQFRDGADTSAAYKAASARLEDLVAALSVDDRDRAVQAAAEVLDALPLPRPLGPGGDPVIQIGTTIHRYGERECSTRFIAVLGDCADVPGGVEVKTCRTEGEVLLAWGRWMQEQDPDVVTGYNTFGFDMAYINDRAEELGVRHELYALLSRLQEQPAAYSVRKLSSSALGDNELKVIAMPGRVAFDLMKVVQRDHRLDSYKLDNVAEHFTGQRKHDVHPSEIAALHGGGPHDRARIAAYCVQDCALCNLLVVKLEVMANNIGMANVCNVPLEWIFMRGQGVKIFSLVLKQCREDGFVIPVVRAAQPGQDDTDDSESYEGAIVLDPKEGLYIDDPVSVLDYASLYPSSMISENLSHDRLVLDERYAACPGVTYHEVCYDVYDDTGGKVGERRCRYALDEQGVLPRILTRLVAQRKATRKRIELKRAVAAADGREVVGFPGKDAGTLVPEGTSEPVAVRDVADRYDAFEKAVLDGLQLAYKVTANSLYGQMGARTSPLYLKDIAACTTATGRNMILKAKAFLEANYGADVIYGDTDSLFCCFKNVDPATGEPLKGKAALMASIGTARAASREFKKLLKPPHDLEYEKTFLPFLLLSRKRYTGLKYEDDPEHYKHTSMGIVLKRRDNANIVKKVYGGVLDIVLKEADVARSIAFLRESMQQLVKGQYPMEDLVITKSLRAEYKDPDKIAHKVLAERMGARDPGNKPQVNDRIPFVYIETPRAKATALQGEKIEHPDYVRAKGLKVDYGFYITNQIMRPVCQMYATMYDKVPGFKKSRKDYEDLYKFALADTKDPSKAKDRVAAARERDMEAFLFGELLVKLKNKREGNQEITNFFKRPLKGQIQ